MKALFLVLIVVVAFLEVAGDILFKEWVIHNNKLQLFLGVIIFTIATIIWAFSLKYGTLSKSMVIFAVITLIVGVLVGVLFYKESLTTTNIIGIVLGLASIVLLEI